MGSVEDVMFLSPQLESIAASLRQTEPHLQRLVPGVPCCTVADQRPIAAVASPTTGMFVSDWLMVLASRSFDVNGRERPTRVRILTRRVSASQHHQASLE